MQTCAQAQEAPAQENTIGKQYLKDVLHDEKIIWTSPARIRSSHLPWLIPFFATTGGLIATDSNVAKQLPGGPSLISNSRTFANAGLALAVGGGASYYLWGHFAHNEHARETGVLSSEAAIHSAIVAEVLKLMTQRDRPVDDVRGRFFQGGSSFPSEHSMLTWSIATVFAHEYPHTIIPFLAYSGASGVSIVRVLSRDHFPSDILVGSVFGYAIGRYVYNTHHDQELPGANIGTFTPSGPDYRREGTTWVAMDSWVYPALDRLSALGYANGISGLRPWTRIECARMVQEAGQTIEGAGAGPDIVALYQRLAKEFAPEIEGTTSNSEGRIEDLYARAGFISGQPLADDYHFAKTNVDDFGRPFGEGANLVSGVSSRVIAGSFGLYVRGEYEHAGTLPAYSAPVLQAIANADSTPFAVQQRTSSLNRFRFLDSYVSLNYRNNIISFGKQTLWWGPGVEAPFIFSDNVEPLPLLRISRATPFVLPWIFHYLGGIRFEFIWGQLNGTHFVATRGSTPEIDFTPPIRPHPYIHGEKVSFKPTRNFEFALGLTVLFGGPGSPLTVHNLLRAYRPGSTAPGQSSSTDVADGRSAFDFSYRIPGLRDWLTFYGDSFTEDEFSPISFPRKSSMRGGFYMPKLPKLNRLDLRAEGLYTDIPSLGAAGIEYFNARFRSGYTNWGQIIGSWVGREGSGISAYSTYHLSEKNDFTLHYRNQKVNPEFLQGGHLQDFAASGTFAKTNGLTFKGSLQYEHWAFPLLSAVPKNDVTGSLEIRFEPSQGWKLW